MNFPKNVAHFPSYNQNTITMQPEYQNWQQEMADSVRSVDELFRILQIPLNQSYHQAKSFPIRVPKAFVAKMKRGDAQDPLLLQVLPQIAETKITSGYSTDPLSEDSYNIHKGILHKYRSRVLLTLTGACAIHCRYCFRQHFNYAANLPNKKDMQIVLDYLQSNPQVNEIILSGGDPLSLNNDKLQAWLALFEQAHHIKTIRIHTRLPVVLPNRIDKDFVHTLQQSSKHLVMVLHINHPNEIDQILYDKCQQLKHIGITLLNQTVLLRNINDDAKTLTTLSHRLFFAGVLPYYLHILDKVQGAAHFDLPIDEAVKIYWQLLENLSGYLVPKLVQELPNHPYKTPVNIYLPD